jgi:DNA-binding NarL/FixJ family response regulator
LVIGVDYTPFKEQIHRNVLESRSLLGTSSLVICSANRLALGIVSGWLSSPDQLLGVATTEAEGLALVERHQPDVVISSEQLDHGCGMALVVNCKTRAPERRTLLVVTNPRRRAQIRAAIRAGCDGICLESQIGLGSGAAALQAVCRGGLYLDRELRSLFNHPELDRLAGPSCELTARELEVLARAMEGSNNGEIANCLNITAETVKSHIGHVIVKLGARNRTHAAVLAVRLGLVD